MKPASIVALLAEKGASRIGRAALSLVLVLPALPAGADLARCQSALQAETSRLIADVSKALQSCVASARRARALGGSLHRAAEQCERSLMKVYNAAGVSGRSAVDRFRASIERLHPRQCSDDDLLAMGYFVPGINAPGRRGPCADGAAACRRDSECTPRDHCPGAMGDVTRRLAAQADHAARRTQLQIVPDTVELVAALIDLEPGPGGALGTADCSQPLLSPAPAGYRKRPNLCRLRPFVSCATRQCKLSVDSGITLSPLGISVRLEGHTLPVEICAPAGVLDVGRCACSGGRPGSTCTDGAPCRSDADCGDGTCETDVVHFSLAAQGSTPAPMGVSALITACVELVSAAGWCDCDAQGAPFAPEVCIDHLVDAEGKDDCGGPAVPPDREGDGCGCAFIGGVAQAEPLPACTVPDCERCVRRGSDRPCHPGTSKGALRRVWRGGSGATDCLLRATMKLSFVPPAFCVDAAGQIRGTCTAAGPPDPLCTAIGGVRCRDARGANGVACDADDATPWTLFPVTAELTTGTARARIADFVFSEGVCTAPGNMNCLEDSNCPAPATCAGATFGCGSGGSPGECEALAGPGAGISCSQLRAGALAGWKLAGAAAAIDLPAGLHDALLQVTLACE